MGKEIETKVPLTEEQFASVFNLITGREKSSEMFFEAPKFLFKSDGYYSQYKTREERMANEPKVIRIRKERFFDEEEANRVLFQNNAVKDYESIISHRENLINGKNYRETAFFTIKHKALENGVEFNQEYETAVEDASVLETFFSATKFDCWFCKEKLCFSVMFHLNRDGALTFHGELETVFGLPYLEVEYTRDDAPADEVRRQLEECIRSLGIDPTIKDNLSWIEIVNKAKEVKSE